MIRSATAADLDAIMTLERSLFPEDAWSPQTMRAEVESPHGAYFVAENSDGLFGYAGLRVVAGSAEGDVQTLAIAAASQGKGHGRALLRQLLVVAAQRQARSVFLDVREDNTVAISLYESEGFEPVDRRQHYYPGGVDAIVMRASLGVAS